REEVEFIQTAYKSLFHFLLNAQARRFQAGEAMDNYVDPQSLPIQERYLLRHALEATGRLQGLVNASFGNLFY
ncbi:MAG: putative nucleotidyltransferase substrate binding domain-containing protein, partial [Elusimicrobiales bacterium]|nr:putative nucleotidyltransferase substrate binding domain-containing protein [Elusimicrobiales bacterium]